MVHEFNLRNIEMWARTDVAPIGLGDDWGTQPGAARSHPGCGARSISRSTPNTAGSHMPQESSFSSTPTATSQRSTRDFIEIGVNAVNSQLFCMDIEQLGRAFGPDHLLGEIDRQNILPYGQPEDVREAVRRVRRALDDGRGGVIAQLEWGKDVPRENVETAFEAWLE